MKIIIIFICYFYFFFSPSKQYFFLPFVLFSQFKQSIKVAGDSDNVISLQLLLTRVPSIFKTYFGWKQPISREVSRSFTKYLCSRKEIDKWQNLLTLFKNLFPCHSLSRTFLLPSLKFLIP